ncbi:MAG TPA: DNA translocase FtsK [Chthonomonadaceae bacterium]|nr:DNA translocase FtsK [Chthonomonadaceae bacterium]
MVKVRRARRQDSEAVRRRNRDIIGLLLFFLGAAGLLCLSWKQSGLLPPLMDSSLHALAGKGAYAIPLLFMFVGTFFLIGYERLTFSESSLGALLLFLVFVTGWHVHGVPSDNPWSTAGIEFRGGWIGWMFGAPLTALTGGPLLSDMFLIFLALVAVVLIVDQPFIEIVRRVHARSREGVLAGAALIPARSKNGRTGTRKMLAPAASSESDRAERAARVVERALVPAGAANRKASVPDADEPEADGPSKRWRLFPLTRSRRDQEEEERPETGDERRLRNGDRAPAEPEDDLPVVRERALPARREPKADSLPTVIPSDGASQPQLSIFVLPPLTILKEKPPASAKRSQAELTDKVHIIEQTLEQFNIGANVVEVASGPSVTRYEVQLAPGIKVSKIVSLADNLAMSLAAIDVRVEAPIPGKSAIGVEVPNSTPVTVTVRECLDTDEFRNAPSKLTFALGTDVAGQYRYADLTKMPHLLIGGSTNSGKSICLNSLIASLTYRATPREVKMLMIDPKRVELSLWDGIPHLMHPVVKDVKQAAGLFRAALKEMDRRYDIFASLGTRNIDGYNAKVPETERLPYIVLIVDELADLMLQQGPEIETSICRLAQLARATGIHLVIATQRPSVDIITGTIKANISSRIAFAVASQVDSRTILDMTGADRLIGRGDMLFMPIDAAKPMRIQGCYISESETNALVDYLKAQERPSYSFTIAESSSGDGRGGGGSADDDVDDDFFEQAVRLVVNNGQCSTSMLQRRFRIGYTRAARIVEMMEERGIVGPLNGAKPREILISKDEMERLFDPTKLPGVDDYIDEGDE